MFDVDENGKMYRRNIVDEQDREWSVYNEEVWEALEPCLRFASKILERLFTHPWVSDRSLSPLCNLFCFYHRL